jgi:hypothetical protein
MPQHGSSAAQEKVLVTVARGVARVLKALEERAAGERPPCISFFKRGYEENVVCDARCGMFTEDEEWMRRLRSGKARAAGARCF